MLGSGALRRGAAKSIVDGDAGPDFGRQFGMELAKAGSVEDVQFGEEPSCRFLRASLRG